MKTLKQLCTPRASVFDRARRDTVLDLTDLMENRISAKEFFEENYLTSGMKVLFETAFRRFSGHNASGVIKLTQAMGGGKTHNMIALGLLAKNPEVRRTALNGLNVNDTGGRIRVVAFTGRESDAPLGIWGSIAEQLGRKEQFKDYYAPLAAPGQTAWINLLKGDPLLILLDEIPPYLDAVKSKTVGNSDLSVVTTTALANLFVAVEKEDLSNVCVVISDLRGSYQGGTGLINQALGNLEKEVQRLALNLEPVGLNTDEVYHILRKRLFEKLPDTAEIKEVVQGYGKALREAKQMDLTNVTAESITSVIPESYPFHPAIKDLYARFRENPGFQQTRGLLRLMRSVVARMYADDTAGATYRYLIHPHDMDLNDRDTRSEIVDINTTLDNAISHDVASSGTAMAELLDKERASRDATDAAKLLLISSLSNVPGAVQGLTLSETVAYLATPGHDITKLKETLSILSTQAWYLHTTRDGRLFFKNVQNLVAKLKTTADTYNKESAMKELRVFLENIFAPVQKDCYQAVNVFPALDELTISQDKVTLVVYEPHHGDLHPDLAAYYQDLGFKNRIMFLSGQRDTMDSLVENAREYKAIGQILKEMEEEKVPANDPQRQAGNELKDKITLKVLSAARETFTSLSFPHTSSLMKADFYMNYMDNNYRGEQQICEVLASKQKFTKEIQSDTFRKKCEQRLFGNQKTMPWSEIKKRAAMNIQWQWHHPKALDDLKATLTHQDKWREVLDQVEIGPFEQPPTSVKVQQISRNDETGEAMLKIIPVNGDAVYYEIGGVATAASMKISDLKAFKTKELRVSFVCVDSTGEHQTGAAMEWTNKITIKSKCYQDGDQRKVQLVAAPTAPIRYTTEGSNPKVAGALYQGPFALPPAAKLVLAIAEKDGIESNLHHLDVEEEEVVKIDPTKPVIWRSQQIAQSTASSYELIAQLNKFNGKLSGVAIVVGSKHWAELNFDQDSKMAGAEIQSAVEMLRSLLGAEQDVSLRGEKVHFELGQGLLDWVAEVHTELSRHEVE